MKRIISVLILTVAACTFGFSDNDNGRMEDSAKMMIQVTANGKTTVFELNGSRAAEAL